MADSLWTSAELAKATGGELIGASTSWAVNGISTDSRTLQPGDLFIALKGDHFDGHDHALEAQAAGAGGLLLAHTVPGVSHALRVPDTLKALEKIAASARSRCKEEVFAVTGSAGKTTTKEMLRAVLAAQAGQVHATVGNLNNHIGVPLTLARTPRDTNFGVFELGMNHSGEIAPLSRLIRPDVALITTVGTAHVQNFPDGAAGIARAKAEIFAGVTEDGLAILPRDSDFFSLLCDAAKARGVEEIFSFGTHKASDARLIAAGDVVQVDIMGNRFSYALPLPGAHMAMNSLAVLLALAAAGLDVAAGVRALATLSPLKGRGLQRVVGGITVIDESYNANPQSMQAAIRVLGGTPASGRRVAVLGDMLELGDTAPAAHAALAADLAAAKADLVFCCGDLMRHLWQDLPESRRGGWASDSAQLAPLVAEAVQAGDVVLVKGSRGQMVNLNGVMSPCMALVLHALDDAQEAKADAV